MPKFTHPAFGDVIEVSKEKAADYKEQGWLSGEVDPKARAPKRRPGRPRKATTTAPAPTEPSSTP